MNIEVKNITIIPEASRETVCFCGELWIEGTNYGQVYNEGRGGMHWASNEAVRRLQDYADSLPHRTCDDTPGLCYMPTWETLVDDAVRGES